jgi:hypothetical protein
MALLDPKSTFLCMLKVLLVTLIILPLLSIAQERGMKPVVVNFDGQTTTLYKESHALVIGVSRYTGGLSSLPGVMNDIDEVKKTLEKNGFHVVEVINPDAAALKQAFTDFIATYGQDPGNRLLFYFAGHGYTVKMPYGDDIGYLCPANAPNPNINPAAFPGKALAMSQIEIYAREIKSNHALFLFDACFAGQIFASSRAIPEIISYKTREPVRQFITSGSANETVPDVSIFRPQFTRALNGEADANRDGFLTGTELGDYLQTTVVNYSNNTQHPQYGKIRNPNLDKGDFVFALKPATVKPVVIERERTLMQYGKLDLTTEISGVLYIDGEKIKQVSANTVMTLKDLSAGMHTIRIEGDETVEKEVTIPENATAMLTIEKKPGLKVENIPDMVYIQGSTFQMGSNEGESNEKPVHSVTLSSFFIGKTEVTQI